MRSILAVTLQGVTVASIRSKIQNITEVSKTYKIAQQLQHTQVICLSHVTKVLSISNNGVHKFSLLQMFDDPVLV